MDLKTKLKVTQRLLERVILDVFLHYRVRNEKIRRQTKFTGINWKITKVKWQCRNDGRWGYKIIERRPHTKIRNVGPHKVVKTNDNFKFFARNLQYSNSEEKIIFELATLNYNRIRKYRGNFITILFAVEVLTSTLVFYRDVV